MAFVVLKLFLNRAEESLEEDVNTVFKTKTLYEWI